MKNKMGKQQTKKTYYILQFDTRDEEVNLYSFEAENEEEAHNEFENADGNYLRSSFLTEKQYLNLLKAIKELALKQRLNKQIQEKKK